MKAIALADKIHIEAETSSDVATINLITRGKVCLLGSGLGSDERGNRVANMTVGRWEGSSDEEARLDRKRLASLEHLLASIPPCPAHGEGCIAYAIEWVARARAEADG